MLVFHVFSHVSGCRAFEGDLKNSRRVESDEEERGRRGQKKTMSTKATKKNICV
jgi:hypothetical protein